MVQWTVAKVVGVSHSKNDSRNVYGLRNYPGPIIYPIVGCLPEILLHINSLYDWSTELLQRSKTKSFVSVALNLNEVLVASPEILEYVLKTNFSNYPKGPEFQSNFEDLLGHGIFNSDGEAWLRQRKNASVQFSASSLRALIVTSVRKETTERLLPTFKKAMEDGAAIDVQDALLRYTFDNICQIGFGVDPGCLAPELPTVPFAQAFDEATKATLLRNMMPAGIWKTMKWFGWGSEGKLTKAVNMVRTFADGVIERRSRELALVSSGNSNGNVAEKYSDLLSRLMALSSEDGGRLYSDAFLRDACTNFILAGRDTSAVALSWLFWLLTWHPHVEASILEELNGILNKREKEAREDPCFSYEELKDMNYLQACLLETLRLYPSVPVDSKYALKEDVLPDGTRVHKGWRVTYVVYAMGRMQSIWGSDASEFRPERWLTPSGACKVESPFKFPAFNAGPRLCLGKDMAMIQMKSVASIILRNFRLKLLPGHCVSYSMSLTLFMKNGLAMTVNPR